MNLLVGLTASYVTISGAKPMSQQSSLPATPTPHMQISVYTIEGLRVAHAMWATFWDAERQHFRTLKKSSETVSVTKLIIGVAS